MADIILVNGLVWGRNEPLVRPMDYDEFVSTLLEALGRDKEHFREEASSVGTASAFRVAFEFHSPDLNDPLTTKWALLLPPLENETEKIAAALQPLVQHRQGQVIHLPTTDSGKSEDWIFDVYTQMPDDERPYYVLIAGSPQAIPFRFQYLLDVHAAVGRLPFSRLEDYAGYAKKIVDFETNSESRVGKHAVFFAPELNGDYPTFLSRNHMANPLVEMVEKKGIPVSYLAGQDATQANLESLLRGEGGGPAPALVYTASHGLGVSQANEDARRKWQGALCCQDYNGRTGVFSADCVPEEPFLHGSIMVTFACYGAGTPRESDFFHWIRDPGLLSCCPEQDFVAALPERLLAHPQGPLAFVGHLDPAWIHSFADPGHIADDQGWGSRMNPFRETVGNLLEGACVGYAAKRFNEVYSFLSVKLANMEDQFRRDSTRGQNSQWTRQMVDVWMTRNDTQNFIVLGDPAAKAKIG